MKTSEMFINSAINSFFHQWSEIDSDLSDGIFFPNSRLVQSTPWAKIWKKSDIWYFIAAIWNSFGKSSLDGSRGEQRKNVLKCWLYIALYPLVIVCTVYMYYYCTFSLFLPLLWANWSSGLWKAYPFFDDFLRLLF